MPKRQNLNKLSLYSTNHGLIKGHSEERESYASYAKDWILKKLHQDHKAPVQNSFSTSQRYFL